MSGCARDHSKRFPKLRQTSFSGIVYFLCRQRAGGYDWLMPTGFLPRGGRGAPPWGSLPPWKLLPLPEIWSENNRITMEICITIDFAPLKKFLEESQVHFLHSKYLVPTPVLKSVPFQFSYVCSEIRDLKQHDHSTGRGGQFFKLISLSTGNTFQLKELAVTSCWIRRFA